MPSKAFGFGNRKGAIQRPNTSNTSPASIRLQKRRAQALELRERGRSYRSIAQELKCSPQTVLNYVVAAMRQTIPKESAQQVLILETRRFDAMLAKFYPRALRGDKAAAELVLRIEHQRARLCGLYPQPNTPLIFNANLNAESDSDFELHFVKPDRIAKLAQEHDRLKTIEHLPMPTETKQYCGLESPWKARPDTRVISPAPRTLRLLGNCRVDLIDPQIELRRLGGHK